MDPAFQGLVYSGFINTAFPASQEGKKKKKSDRHFRHKHVFLAVLDGSLSNLGTPTRPYCLEQGGHWSVSVHFKDFLQGKQPSLKAVHLPTD